jgi:hypothetical protein
LATILQHQWASKLLGFDFRVQYKPGSTNVVADALSRRDIEEVALAHAISAVSFTLFDDLQAEYSSETALTELRQDVINGGRGDQWAIIDDLVTRGGRVFVATSSPSLATVLAHAHGVGHEGVQKMLHKI